MAELKRHMDVLERVSENSLRSLLPQSLGNGDSHQSFQANTAKTEPAKYTTVYVSRYTCVYPLNFDATDNKSHGHQGRRETRLP